MSRKLGVGCRCADISVIEVHDPTLDQLQTPPLPARDHRSRGLAVRPFQSEPREVEEMMLERGIDVSYETIRRWTRKF